MTGVLVNTIAVIIGSLFGILIKKGIPKHISDAIMTAVGLCTMYIGITGTLEGERTLVLICSLIIGTAVGTALDLDGKVNKLGDIISERFKNLGGNITEGFSTASLLFCIGAMAIVGSINAGLKADNEMLFTKSLLDLISAVMLSVSLGIGVMFSAASVFVYQGAIVLLAQLVAPFLSTAVINEITCCGSLIIVALSFNLIGVTKIKIANMLPAIIIVPLIFMIKFL